MRNTTATTHPLTLARIQAFLTRIYKSKFVRNVAVVASGTAGAQVIVIAFSPIITRLYGPETFGILGTFMAIVAVITPIAALSYPIAIVLPKEDSDARGIARLSACIALGVAVLTSLVLMTSGDRIVNLLQVQEVSSYIWLLPLFILFAAWLQINQQWVIRKKHFGVNARAAVLHAFIVNAAKSVVGLYKPLAAVLIVLAAAGQALHAGLLSLGASKADRQALQEQEAKSHTPLKDLARWHYDFPLYRAPQVFINAISQGLPVLMLAAFFGPASAGFYAICRRVLNMPSTLIGKSVLDVFYPRITDAAHKGENLTLLILKATMAMAGVGFIPFALVVAFGPWLFGYIFGTEWITAGEYARWLALWLFFAFINRPSVASIPVMQVQGYFLVYEIFSVVLRIITLVVGCYLFKDDILAIILFSMAGVLLNTSLIITLFANWHRPAYTSGIWFKTRNTDQAITGSLWKKNSTGILTKRQVL
jgi:O-antigen/teichoic acid export membrane protein